MKEGESLCLIGRLDGLPKKTKGRSKSSLTKGGAWYLAEGVLGACNRDDWDDRRHINHIYYELVMDVYVTRMTDRQRSSFYRNVRSSVYRHNGTGAGLPDTDSVGME